MVLLSVLHIFVLMGAQGKSSATISVRLSGFPLSDLATIKVFVSQ